MIQKMRTIDLVISLKAKIIKMNKVYLNPNAKSSIETYLSQLFENARTNVRFQTTQYLGLQTELICDSQVLQCQMLLMRRVTQLRRKGRFHVIRFETTQTPQMIKREIKAVLLMRKFQEIERVQHLSNQSFQSQGLTLLVSEVFYLRVK